jgi:hypothetical protein
MYFFNIYIGNFKPDDYEIVCPNAVMGCTHTFSKKNLHEHLLSCSYNGISKEKDLEERQLTKQAVLLVCEQERVRRQKHLSSGSGYWSEGSELQSEEGEEEPIDIAEEKAKVCIHMFIYVYKYEHMYVYIYMYMCICVYIYICIYIHEVYINT